MLKNNNLQLRFKIALSFILLAIIVVLGIGYYSLALNPPITQPPTGGGAIHIASNAPANSLYIDNSGYIGIGTTAPNKKLTVAGDMSILGNLSLTRNGVSCEIFTDCDGDNKFYLSGDCDESCPTCYAGSTSYTTSPDGKDQDCDKIVDESDESGIYR